MAAMVPASSAARRVGMLLAAVTAIVVIMFVAVFSIHRLTPIASWKEMFDIGGEANVPTWWNTTLLALVAVTALIAAEISERASAVRRAWRIVAAAAAYLSLDEAASLHERLANVVPSEVDVPTYAWVLPGSLLALAGTAVLVVAGRHLPHPTAGRLGTALAAYGVAAVGLEAVNGRFRENDDDSMLYTVGTLIEESVEMGACVYAVSVIIDAFRVCRTSSGGLVINHANTA